MRTWIAVVGVACIAGSAIGSMMVYIAMQHNPQEAFVNLQAGAVDYAALFPIFLSWFVVAGVVVSLALALVVSLIRD